MATELKELEETALSWPEKAEAVWIVNQASYEAAAEMKVALTELRKQIVEHHAPIKDAAHKSHLAACAAEKKLLDPVKQAESIINGALRNWEDEQELIRLAEVKRLRDEAAARERKVREEAEAAARKAREEARTREEERLLQAALEAEKAGASPETVDKIIATPIPEPVIPVAPAPKPAKAPVVAPTYNRIAGAAPRKKNFHAEIINIVELCRAVAEGTQPQECVEGNMKYLNGRARDEEAELKIPGVIAVQDPW